MSTQPPTDPGQPRGDVAPPGYTPPEGSSEGYPPAYPPPEHRSHAGPWILGAAVVLAVGAIASVLIANSNESDTQTVLNRTPVTNTTVVTPTVSKTTRTVTAPTTTVTAPTTTVTVPAATDESGGATTTP